MHAETQCLVHLPGRSRAVERVEVNAGSAHIEQLLCHLRRDLDTEGTHGIKVIGDRVEPGGELLGELCTGECGESLDLRHIRDGHQARNDRHRASVHCAAFAQSRVILGSEEELGDREFRSGVLLHCENPGVLLEIRRLGVSLRECRDTDAEVAERLDELDEFGRVGQAVRMRMPVRFRPSGRISAQGKDRVDAGIRVLADDASDFVSARAHAGQVSHGKEGGLLGDLLRDAHGAIAGRAAGAVGDRDEARTQRLQVSDGLPQSCLSLIGLRREQLEGEGTLTLGQSAAQGQAIRRGLRHGDKPRGRARFGHAG